MFENIREIAESIADHLETELSPRNSTWGRSYEEAWRSLFTDYREDLINNIESVLKERM